jgi:hypothetical protein
MWEVKAVDGRFAELLGWVREHADPAGQVYASEEQGLLVVIAADISGLDPVPAELIARPAQAWPFREVGATKS